TSRSHSAYQLCRHYFIVERWLHGSRHLPAGPRAHRLALRRRMGHMVGDERVRFCDKCQQNVYNLTAMTSTEAEHFLVEREGRACVRAYRRADGTIRIGDCPWGVRVARRTAAKMI